jgi:L-amino acid N-acyltransferase YncA
LEKTINFREKQEGDLNFIMSSYLKSYRTAGDNTRMTNEVYFFNYKKIIARILERCQCLIACDPEDEAHLYGYILYEMIEDMPVLHYVYVKHVYRYLGIAKQLAEKAIGKDNKAIVASHVTKIFDNVSKKYNIYYNPFLRLHK